MDYLRTKWMYRLFFALLVLFSLGSLRAELNSGAGDKIVLSVFIGGGKGEAVIICDPSKHVLYTYERTAADEVIFTSLRDYTYDLLLEDYSKSRDSRLIPDSGPGNLLAYLREVQFKKDEAWLKEYKEKKIRKLGKKEQRTKFREWVRKQCRPSLGQTGIVTVETSSSQSSRLIALYDDANTSILFYKYEPGQGLVLSSARDVESDIKLGEHVNAISSPLSVAQAKREYEKRKKDKEGKGESEK